MRKLSGFIVLLCLILISATPIPIAHQDGVYNTVSRLYWCENPSACIHEVGHKLDQESGWASTQGEFGKAVKIFILAQSKFSHPDPLLYELFQEPDFSISELYARIFEYSGGNLENIPEMFRKFYNWKRAKELLGR